MDVEGNGHGSPLQGWMVSLMRLNVAPWRSIEPYPAGGGVMACWDEPKEQAEC